jgi:succinate-acetate transporter protein
MIPTTPAPVRDGIANPAPLGLCAFGMTTVLLNFKNAGIIEISSMILAMGIFYGGLAQVIAGIIEAKKNNTLWFNRIYIIWLLLVVVSGLNSDPIAGMDTKTIRGKHERLFGHVGLVYVPYVFRHLKIKPGAAICIWVINHPFCFIGNK